jgi:outer membrane protein
MKNKLFIILLGCSACSTIIHAQTDIKRKATYTASELVDIALKTDPLYQSATIDATLLDLKYQQSTFKAFLPSLDFSLDTRYNIKRQTLVLPSGAFGGPTGTFKRIEQGTPWNTSAAFDLKQPLFDPNALANRKLIAIQKTQFAPELEQRKQVLNYEIELLYHQFALAQTKLELQKIQTEDKKETLDEIMIRNAKGTSTKLEFEQAKVELDLAKYSEEIYTTEMENIQSKLEKYTGKLEKSLIATDLEQSFADVKTLPEIFDMSTRADFQIQQQKINENKRIVDSKMYGYLPTINFTARLATQAFRDKFDFLSNQGWYPYSYVGIDLKLPLFDGFQKKYSTKIVGLEIEKGQLKLQEIERVAFATQNEAISNLKLSKMQVNLREMELAAHRLRYQSKVEQVKLGTATSADLKKMDAEFAQINLTLYLAYLEAIKANLEFKKAQGKW